MPAIKKRIRQKQSSIIYLRTDEIQPNPAQPRRQFREDELAQLSNSIEQFGVINPLSVRMRLGKFELIAGERRLRAAKMAGLTEVPCILLDVNMEESSLLALVENLQRKDLDFVEEAEGIARLIRTYSLSQEEAAQRLGKSQSAIANKLRLLKLPSDVLQGLLDANLSERHGRALLRLQTAELQRSVLSVIIERGLNVAATDDFVERVLSNGLPLGEPERPRGGRTLFIMKDVRIFLNTLARSIDVMKKGGVDAGVVRTETDNELILTISIPKKH